MPTPTPHCIKGESFEGEGRVAAPRAASPDPVRSAISRARKEIHDMKPTVFIYGYGKQKTGTIAGRPSPAPFIYMIL
jgi:hypothetical protein